MPKCSECGGSGKYQPLIGPAEGCRACGGSGESGLFIPAEYATDGMITENMILASAKYVWLAQRYDAVKHNLIAGAYYLHNTNSPPLSVGPRFDFNISHKIANVYRQEFPSKGFKLLLPGDPGYAVIETSYGNDPCIEHGTLFVGHSQNYNVEFFASQDTMGIAFVRELASYSSVELGAKFESGIYIPTIVKGTK